MKNLLILCLLLFSIQGFSQVIPVLSCKIPDPTLPFGQNLSKGTEVFVLSDSTKHTAVQPIVGTETMTTAASSFISSVTRIIGVLPITATGPNGKVTISIVPATTTTAGSLSAVDKVRVDSIPLLERKSNKVITISAGSTDVQYPSAKLLYDQLATKEPTITAGTTGQYWRGDKTWQTLPTNAATVTTSNYYGGTEVYPVWTSANGSSFLNTSANDLKYSPATGFLTAYGMTLRTLTLPTSPRIYLGGSAGSAGQVLTSGGTGADAYWGSAGGGSMIYPSAGIPISTGTAWGASITDNSANWNTAYSWGNHASAGYSTLQLGTTSTTSYRGDYGNTAYNDRLKWDGGATDLNASTGRTSLGLGGYAVINSTVQALSGTTVSWDCASGINATLTLSGTTTVTLSNITTGSSGNITITNPSGTANVLTFAVSGKNVLISPAVYVSSGRVVTSGSSKIDVFSWYCDGNNLIINGTNDYK